MKMSRRLRPWITASLTLGASLLLGLLSFSGMYAIFPLLGVSLASMLLSVFYEGEIYKKNIQEALDKLFKPNFILEKIGQEALEQLLKDASDIVFVQDYRKAKNHPKKAHQMERWLAKLLLNPPQTPRPYQSDILTRLDSSHYQLAASNLRRRNRWILGFSSLTALVMSLGTVYLMLDMLEVMPIFGIAILQSPFFIFPLAIVAGIAYGLLTYNSLISFLSDHSLGTWWSQFKQQLLVEPMSWRKLGLLFSSLFIFTLNISLTLCTAGTWWTVMNQSRSLWTWFNHILVRAVAWMTPGVMGIANLGFNTRNIIETIKSAQSSEVMGHSHCHHHEHRAQETKVQRWNPFRILLKLTYMPLRILMFVGHLISIGVTGDRMPGVPAILSALLGIISEGFEDAHYFFDFHGEAHAGHEHGDLPNQVLLLLFSPVFALAATWHYAFQAQAGQRTWKDAFYLMRGQAEHTHVAEADNPTHTIGPAWDQEEAFMQVEKKLQQFPNVKSELEQIKQNLEAKKTTLSHDFSLFHQPQFHKLDRLCQKIFKAG